eukprot:gene15839-biopygen18742
MQGTAVGIRWMRGRGPGRRVRGSGRPGGRSGRRSGRCGGPGGRNGAGGRAGGQSGRPGGRNGRAERTDGAGGRAGGAGGRAELNGRRFKYALLRRADPRSRPGGRARSTSLTERRGGGVIGGPRARARCVSPWSAICKWRSIVTADRDRQWGLG